MDRRSQPLWRDKPRCVFAPPRTRAPRSAGSPRAPGRWPGSGNSWKSRPRPAGFWSVSACYQENQSGEDDQGWQSDRPRAAETHSRSLRALPLNSRSSMRRDFASSGSSPRTSAPRRDGWSICLGRPMVRAGGRTDRPAASCLMVALNAYSRQRLAYLLRLLRPAPERWVTKAQSTILEMLARDRTAADATPLTETQLSELGDALERDPAFRRSFDIDPVAAAEAAGWSDLARGLEREMRGLVALAERIAADESSALTSAGTRDACSWPPGFLQPAPSRCVKRSRDQTPARWCPMWSHTSMSSCR